MSTTRTIRGRKLFSPFSLRSALLLIHCPRCLLCARLPFANRSFRHLAESAPSQPFPNLIIPSQVCLWNAASTARTIFLTRLVPAPIAFLSSLPFLPIQDSCPIFCVRHRFLRSFPKLCHYRVRNHRPKYMSQRQSRLASVNPRREPLALTNLPLPGNISC